ncbi:hypothetical protein WAK64_21375 [Bacillus spongiae]|uniref:Uncharacterized protein n=1 Tax=Bacillus spongiae TaxID=2683610 RepID=A0ABU8HKL9_9BACI
MKKNVNTALTTIEISLIILAILFFLSGEREIPLGGNRVLVDRSYIIYGYRALLLFWIIRGCRSLVSSIINKKRKQLWSDVAFLIVCVGIIVWSFLKYM